MSDNEEMEEFNMNDEDFRRAMNPGQGRRGRMSKEQAMLGVFADEYSSDEDGARARTSHHGGGGRAAARNRAGPVSFVMGSTGNRRGDGARGDDDDDGSSDSDEDEKIGNDFEEDNGGEEEEEEDKGRRRGRDGEIEIDASDSENEKEEIVVEKVTKSNKYGLIYADTEATKNKPRTRNEAISKSEIKEIGNWQKYTKGFGMKMLEKMGWEKGKGIGKEMQGRAVPVEATLRKGKGAIGAHGPESKEAARLLKRRDQDDDEDDDDDNQVHVSQWKKDKKGKKPQYALRSADELLKIAAKNPKKLRKIESSIEAAKNLELPVGMSTQATTNKIKVIDMTGKEQRVMHGYESLSQITKMSTAISSSSSAKPKNFDLPELVHNIDMLLDMTEEKILQADKKLKYYEDALVALGYDEKRTQDRLGVEKKHLKRMHELLAAIERLDETAQTETDLDRLIDAFGAFQARFADEFIIYSLSDEAIPFVRPLLSRRMLEWRPFVHALSDDNEPSCQLDYCKSSYAALKELLGVSNSGGGNDYQQPYHRIVWETWMPAVRLQLSSIRLKQYAAECVDLLNEWAPIVPEWILTNILEQIVLPKLVVEVEEWNPLTDRIPIHTWVHPWLPWLKERLETAIFPSIRYKLAHALSSWHPSDESARHMLRPWRPPVWSTSHWDAFMLRCVVPKLEYALAHELALDPVLESADLANSCPPPWTWCSTWAELIAPAHFVDLVERFFFPKWFYALTSWLNSRPDYEQVAEWYNAWKIRLGDRLNQHANVKAKMSQALLMMERSMRGAQVTYTTTVEATTNQRPTSSDTPNAAAARLTGMAASTNSYKDVIQKKAAENNLMFVPVVNKFKDGKQVYRFGNVSIYLEGHVIYMLQNGVWRPTLISELIDKSIKI